MDQIVSDALMCAFRASINKDPWMRKAAGKIEDSKGRSGIVKFSWTALFSGCIPSATRKRIAEVRKSGQFGGKIYLVAEAHEWTEGCSVTITEKDPLVVGFDGYGHWLIDSFDTTPVEQYIADEFATNP